MSKSTFRHQTVHSECLRDTFSVFSHRTFYHQRLPCSVEGHCLVLLSVVFCCLQVDERPSSSLLVAGMRKDCQTIISEVSAPWRPAPDSCFVTVVLLVLLFH